MYKCFANPGTDLELDIRPLKFRHNLVNHPALSIESLCKSIPEMPPQQVKYSKGLSDLTINFDRAHIDHKNDLTIEETIENMKTSNSYIAIRGPEVHPSFKELFQDLISDVRKLVHEQNKGKEIKDPILWMFIASPNAMTPFHFDRASNFLMQIRGSKQVTVFPPMNETVISAEECEAYISRSNEGPKWIEEKEKLATTFDFYPGEMLHIPFVSGHHVKNGPEDVSISLSFFFHNDYTIKTTRGLQMNYRLRKKLGLKPKSIGTSPLRDLIKASILPMVLGVGEVLRKVRSYI